MNSRRGKMWRAIAHDLFDFTVQELDLDPMDSMEGYIGDPDKVKFIRKERKRGVRPRHSRPS